MTKRPSYVLSALCRFNRKNDILASAYDDLSIDDEFEANRVIEWIEQNAETVYNFARQAMQEAEREAGD